MLVVDHDKIILLSTPFPTIPMLATNCCCNVILFYVGNKRRCIVLYCIVLYCIVLYCIVRMHLHGLYQHFIPRNLFAYIVRMHLHGLYQHFIPRNLFAYIITYKYHHDGGYRRAHVKIIK